MSDLKWEKDEWGTLVLDDEKGGFYSYDGSMLRYWNPITRCKHDIKRTRRAGYAMKLGLMKAESPLG